MRVVGCNLPKNLMLFWGKVRGCCEKVKSEWLKIGEFGGKVSCYIQNGTGLNM